ncbi:DNA ligase 3 [Octopus sinensis]|uniref:DNA ligase n=1 Tax=Octopus sinensis TaxID=2607531 RepID=A0A6P7SZV7_9MOLL|nr:DNA ligase 3 [Octopus sinensis]XP_036363778.1 DNA ligase 3 [Octopus sinensis]XP_036363779.1 DNA ligase 3 [Octopus sinensis]
MLQQVFLPVLFSRTLINKLYRSPFAFTRQGFPFYRAAAFYLNPLLSSLDLNSIPLQLLPSRIMAENRFIVVYAKLGTSSCKKCKTKIEKAALRIGKVVPNPFSDDGGDMKQWYHPSCIFETFLRARPTTKIIEEAEDLDGFQDLQQDDKDAVNDLIKDFFNNPQNKRKRSGTSSTGSSSSSSNVTASKTSSTPKKEEKKKPSADVKESKPPPPSPSSNSAESESKEGKKGGNKDDAFRCFRQLCAKIADENTYLGKTQLVSDMLKKGSSGDVFCGDTYLWLKLLLPGVVKLVYNLNSKQLVKLFSQIFGENHEEMVKDLEQGDVAETIRMFFENNSKLLPQKKSTISLQEVDQLLTDLSKVTKEDDQQRYLTKITKRCTGNDLKMVIRLIKHDLRINAGAKHILDGLDPNAYAAFQASRSLQDVVDRVLQNRRENKLGLEKKLSVRASLMTPVLPMLAEPCRSVEMAMRKCPGGFYAEIKYDGERVQVHKNGSEFRYFSRSLKPVQPHKVSHFKDFIPKAFPGGNNLILDAEVLLVDNATSTPLPFGTLGIHKKAAFKDANVCLFVFDCLHLNNENLMEFSIKKRRKILEDNMVEIKNRIMFSKTQFITDPTDLQSLMTKVFREGLEGLVLKHIKSIYEPGKRHWLKVKKDYLEQGSMADSADLVVLGAYYGTGNKGGLMSVFLTGVYNPFTKKWCTVSKVGNGFDDKTLDRLQKELKMVKISKDVQKVPSWLNIKKSVIPDFIVEDPHQAPVWEITGAEFSKAEIHTADGISIRFPRLTKIRTDKSWKEATDLPRLKELYKSSKEVSDFPNLVTPKVSPADDSSKENDFKGDAEQSSDEHKNSQSSPQKTPVKRKIPMKEEQESPGQSSKSKARKIDEMFQKSRSDNEGGDKKSSTSKEKKPMCKYGSGCYQKNPQHLAAFDHSTSSSGAASTSVSDPLPNVFRNMKIYLPKNMESYKKLKRFIIAFDGEILPDHDISNATHLVIVKDLNESDVSSASPSAVCITSEWLWKCIKKKQCVPTQKYVFTA